MKPIFTSLIAGAVVAVGVAFYIVDMRHQDVLPNNATTPPDAQPSHPHTVPSTPVTAAPSGQPAPGQPVYKWTDNQGVVHRVNNPDDIKKLPPAEQPQPIVDQSSSVPAMVLETVQQQNQPKDSGTSSNKDKFDAAAAAAKAYREAQEQRR